MRLGAMLTWRRSLALLIGLAALAATASAQEPAESFPSRAITLVVPYPAGGPPDIAARIVGPAVADILGKPIVIENRPGASTALANGSVARAMPDGYSLLAVDMSFTVAPYLVAISYDPIKDFTPVGLHTRSSLVMAVDPALPANTAQDLVKLAKAKPGEIKFGTSGVGSPPHLGGIAFIQATGIEMLHVPYRGAQAALNDVVGGHISLIFTGPGTAAAQAKGNQVRVLGVTGQRRAVILPDIPTFKESGIDMPAFEHGTWFGVLAPAATPAAIVAKLNAAINKAIADPDTRAKLERTDFTVQGGAPAELGQLIAAQLAYWKGAMQAAGVTPEKLQ